MPTSSYKHINSLSLESAANLEFRSIVKDIKFFDSCVYLGLKSGKWQQDQILPGIYDRPGYEKLKIIKYCVMWTHLYIKFKNPTSAKAAVVFFTNLDPNFSCELTSNLLAQWYYFERLDEDNKKHCTYTVVDVEGNAPEFLNLLDAPIIDNVLRRYGRLKIVPFFGRYVTKVQVMFPTMAEALAASIALGEWWQQKPVDFYYRVRIEPAEKEVALIRDCLKDYEDLVEAFRLDYFVFKDNSTWNRLVATCQELFVQDETTFFSENRDSLELQDTDRFNGITFTNRAMGHEIPDQPEFLPNVRIPLTGQQKFRRIPRRFYENGQISISERNGREARRFSQPSVSNRRNYTPQGSGRHEARYQRWVSKECKKNCGKK